MSTSSASPVHSVDEIVISGISGRFPISANVAEFARNLYNSIDMVDDAETRWKHVHPEIPRRSGKVPNLDKFDASFFSVHNKHAHYMDPQVRCLLEHAYEAILDSGVNPKSIRGSRTGVYVACGTVESGSRIDTDKNLKDGVGLLGTLHCMVANRISFALDLQGPSTVIDAGCASASFALDAAFKDFRAGEIDGAIVAGTNLLLNPNLTLHIARLGVLAKDGFCRPLDKDAAGYTRTETICVIYLQRMKDAKRAYANLVYSNVNNDGFKSEGLGHPSGEGQIRLMSQFYKEIKLNPATVDFVEGHSTGTTVGDPEECHTLDTVFCEGRKGPLLIGAVKSNCGHAEAAAAMCSFTKVVLMFENQLIPPVISYREPRIDCRALVEGRLKVVDTLQEFHGNLIGVNAFGLGGGNAHTLFRYCSKEKINFGVPKDTLPRLVTWSGRTEEAVHHIMDTIAQKPLDAELVALLHGIQTDTIKSSTYRGYGIFTQKELDNAECISKSVKNFSSSKRPVVFVYCGVGSQWIEMGKDLMKIPICANAIDQCHDALTAYGINLKDIITSKNPDTFDNIINVFVGINAIQIALTDVFKAIGIQPDHIVGHSFGELACSYADSCTTLEETILSAYSRGIACLETKAFGSMAAIGMGHRQLKELIPKEIDIACHNSTDHSTISGPADIVADFIQELKENNIFTKMVASGKFPFHSRYIKDVGPYFLKRLTRIITNPKKRSAKWISTSVLDRNSNDAQVQYSSAEYHTNNLLSTVFLEEALALLPRDALTIEIDPCGLFRSVLKRSLPEGEHFGLLERNGQDNVLYLLNSLGKLFENGVDFDASKLYPPINYPVSRGTPMISPLVKWDHSQNYEVLDFEKRIPAEEKEIIGLNDPEYSYLSDHEIDGRVLIPTAAYLYLVWQAIAYQSREKIEDFGVEFEDVRLQKEVVLSKDQDTEISVNLQRGTGRFEIRQGTEVVATGIVRSAKDSKLNVIQVPKNATSTVLYNRDFYKELRLRGYNYKGLFKSVLSVCTDGLEGRIFWQNNWVAFLESLLQLRIISNDTRSLTIPTFLRRVVIRPREHLELIADIVRNEKILHAQFSAHLNALRCGGVEIRGIEVKKIEQTAPSAIPVLESQQFIPYLPTPMLSKLNMARFCVQHVLENFPTNKIVAVEIDANDGKDPIIEYLGMAIDDLPVVTYDLTYITTKEEEFEKNNIKVSEADISTLSGNTFIIRSKCLQDKEFLESISSLFGDNGFVISRESNDTKVENLAQGYKIFSLIPTEDELIALVQYNKIQPQAVTKVIKISSTDSEFSWIEKLQDAIKEGPVIAYAEKDELNGIIGLVKCIRSEPNGKNVRCFFIDDTSAPTFDIEHPFYQKIISYNFAINVYRDGKWGSFRHFLLERNYKPNQYSDYSFVDQSIRGNFSSVEWVEGPTIDTFDENLIRVQYLALNEKGVDTQIEFAGVDHNGKKIMGIGKTGPLATHINSQNTLFWNVSESWTLEEAVTIPIAYSTVYLAFFIVAKIEKGKSILIHDGSGSIGLAAIRTALSYGLEVFTTIDADEEKGFLLKEFPQLKPENISSLKDTSFEDMIGTRTSGKGVDYVLNSLIDEKFSAFIRCLGEGGKFLKVGGFNMASDIKIEPKDFVRNLTFHSIELDCLLKEYKMEPFKLIEKDLRNGRIAPLKRTVFKAYELKEAFEHFANGKCEGKVLIQLREKANDQQTLPITVHPRVFCNPQYSYVIPGGLGGFGLELANWLVMRNCRKLVLSSRRGITNQYQAYRIQSWESYGVKVVVDTSDITSKDGCEELLRNSMKLGPVGGIFNLAVFPRNAIFENQDAQRFIECFAPKAVATRYLDEMSRILCPELQYFVVFSSVSSGRGYPGISNYGMANSVLERIIEQRAKVGLPAKAIQWGPIGDVGLLVDMLQDRSDAEFSGTLQQRISSCLEELDHLIPSDFPVVASMVVAEKRNAKTLGGNIIETVVNAMSIKDIKSVSVEATLSELGMDSLMTVEVQQVLQREYQLAFSAQDLRSMTLSQIKNCVEKKDGV